VVAERSISVQLDAYPKHCQGLADDEQSAIKRLSRAIAQAKSEKGLRHRARAWKHALT